MIEFISSILGIYTLQSYSFFFTFLNSQIAIMFFAKRLNKRNLFIFRIIFSILIGLGACLLLAFIHTTYNSLLVRVLCYLAVTILNLMFTFICFENRLANILLVYCSGAAANQVVGKFYPLIQNILGIDDKKTISLYPSANLSFSTELVIYFIYQISLYWLLAHFFSPKSTLGQKKEINKNVIILSFFVILTVNVLICISRVYESESFVLNVIVKIFCIGFGIIVLFACGGILSQNEKEQQIQILNQLWKQDMVQFESVKANMDVINMKCHNLKKVITNFEDRLSSEELFSLNEAIQFYDANIKTGNKVLDIILSEKSMLCQKHKIKFLCMADGKKLLFLTPVQTYSLFSNIIDNAFEAVQKLNEPENKLISLICQVNDQYIEIEESNYFEGTILLENNLPVTSKEDTARHSFGIKSIKYITELYGGQVSIETKHNMFFLKIRFPIQNLE